jgi:hypothetical protein
MSPTQRTLKALRGRGFFAEVVERWNPHARIRQDLYRWVDIVAVKAGEPILGVQTTSGPNAAARIDKARGNAALSSWIRAGGRLAVFAWAKHKRRLASGGWSERPVWDLLELSVELVDIETDDGPAALVVGSRCSSEPQTRELCRPEDLTDVDAVVEWAKREPEEFRKLWAKVASVLDWYVIPSAKCRRLQRPMSAETRIIANK